MKAIYASFPPFVDAKPNRQARDDSVHFALLNWSRYIKSNMHPAPWEQAEPASWQREYVPPRLPDDPDPHPVIVDEKDAEQVQAAMVRLMTVDMDVARVLTQHYRDDFSFPRWLLRDCRKVFWRYL